VEADHAKKETGMRIALLAAGALLVGTTATACGGPPEAASTTDFCKALQAAPTADKPSQDDIDEWADQLKDTGTPDDISDGARNGFEVLVGVLDDVDVNDIDEDTAFEDVVEDTDDRKDVEKFFLYAAKKCGGLSGADLPSSTTELPSGLPTQ